MPDPESQRLFNPARTSTESADDLEDEESVVCCSSVLTYRKRDQRTLCAYFAGVLVLIIFAFSIARVLYPMTEKPLRRNVIMMVSDGFGPASETFARNYHTYINDLPYDSQLPLDTILVGSSRTRSSSSLVTDSAAGATAFSCGLKSYNGAIGVDPSGKPCGTVLEAAKLAGYTTGLVVTSRITHATPASFASHAIHRDQENEIALQEIGNYTLGRMTDLMFGGGQCHFLPNTDANSCRQDSIDVFERAKDFGWHVGTTRQDFDNLNASNAKLPLMLLFTRDHMSYEIDRDPAKEPSIKESVLKALSILTSSTENSDKGFFLLIEGSRIDMAAHSNDAATHVHEILAYNEMVQEVIGYVNAHPGTVMISVSDHETGGFSVAKQVDSASYPEYLWKPEALVNVTRSSEKISADLAAYNGQNRTEFVKTVVLEQWLGVHDYTEQEVQKLAQPGLLPSQIENILSPIISDRAQLGWATHGHSAVDVNLYAHGANSDALRGNHENIEIGHFITNFLSLDLASVTKTLSSMVLPPFNRTNMATTAVPFEPIHHHHQSLIKQH
ncbi:alkaline-phosphatase-like protein [Polychytrium aggregatum]|uniref:alkaline-phosphatase-like protein n=1 Tax=Polychytrium aggregatum TaxID=110093 RepID=UPI0022FE5525|nr:alkaline-phosphatase-like protein [Polychytrium aggregatum]KAI9205059.1 alkaline-phosphatase-like protein [Polychytrium aggregatum]